jgi:hypothetical protein
LKSARAAFLRGALEQVVARDAELIGEALQGISAGAGDAALVATDVRVVPADLLAELGLGEALDLAELAKAILEAGHRGQGAV